MDLKNEDLNNKNLPVPCDTWKNIARFSHTFIAYSYWGSFEKTAKVAENVKNNYTKYNNFDKNTLIDLRTELFFVQRTCNHLGEPPTGDLLVYVHKLIEGIRIKVNERNF